MRHNGHVFVKAPEEWAWNRGGLYVIAISSEGYEFYSEPIQDHQG